MWEPEWGWKFTETNLPGSLSRIAIYSGNTLAKLELERDREEERWIIWITKIELKVVDWKKEKINVRVYMAD